MGYGIIITLNEEMEKKVRETWHAFELAGIGQTPGQFYEPPHVAFSDTKADSPEKLWLTARDIAAGDVGLKLVPFGVFPGRKHVIYYNAVLSEGLRKAHIAHYELLQINGIQCNQLYSPYNVLFHCTVVVDVEDDMILEGTRLMLKHGQPLQGHAAAVELWEYFPVKLIYRKKLAS